MGLVIDIMEEWADAWQKAISRNQAHTSQQLMDAWFNNHTFYRYKN